MQLKSLLIIPIAVLALSGCINERPGECDIPENLVLIFTYNDAPDLPFTDFITTVDVILFDAQGSYYTQRRIEVNELSTSLTARFTVPSGMYYAVAWGNVLDHSRFSDLIPGATMFEDCFVEINDSATDTGDPVFYAPYIERPGSGTGATTRNGHMTLYEVDVPPGTSTTKTLDFVRAHRTINVWIRGYNETMEGVEVHPDVTITQRWSRYDFFFTPSIRRDYRQPSHVETVEGVVFDEATFHNGIGQIDDDIEVILTSPTDDSQITTIGLAQFVAENNIINTNEIDILITFLSDNEITVTVPVWSETPLQPGV